MKKEFLYLKKSRWLLLTLLAILAGASPTWADELTVHDGTTTNAYLPLYGYYVDSNGTTSEFIIPSADLADMKDKLIEQMTFYISSAASKKFGATFNVYLEEVTGDNYDDSSASQLTESKTLVYTGALDADGTTLIIPFDTEYTYNGGNLLIATEVTTKGSYASASFYGTTTTFNAGRCKYSSATNRYKFIPKTTFTYGTANPYKKPASISVGETTTTTALISWTAGSGDSSETGWNLEYKKSTDENWTEVHGLSASPLSYTLSELEANTTYDVRVQAVYSGGESNFVATTFKTAKVATPATGFTDNFETDKGWDLINGTVPNKWVRGTGTNNGGSYSLYISNDGINYNSSYGSSSLVFASKLFYFEAGDYTVSYDWLCNGESGYDFLRVGLVSGDTELSASTSYSNLGSTSTLPSGWTMWLDGGSPLSGSTTWATKSVDFTIETAGNYQVVFGWRNDYSGGSYPAAIDNFKILGATPVLELGGDVTGTTLAFGSVSETTNKTIRITNSGKVAMENITLTETADEDNVFAYADLPKTTLAANEYMDVQVTFSGSSAKDYTGTFRVAADDCDPIDVTITATYSNSPATMAITLGEDAVGETVAFGNVGKQATKTFTVTNDGDQTLNVAIASDNTTDFTVSPAALAVTGHSSETFTVTFLYDENARDVEKTANITVTASNEGVDPVVFAVTGTRIEQWSEDFSGNALPDGWETTSTTYWTFADGVAKGTYQSSNYYLVTPSLTVEEGASLSFDVCANTTYVTMTIQKKLGNGDWTDCKDINYSSDFGATGVWKTFTIDGLDPGNYKFRFNARGFWLDNFQGFKRNQNDPKLGIYSDEECTVAVATSVSKDFGFTTETQTTTYYIKNDGTGTMTLSLGDAPDGITQSLDKTSVTAGEHATLTITMPAENKGYNGGNVVVTATDLGTFTVAASGVIVDEDKLYLDFATANIPSTWTKGDWTKSNYGYIENSTWNSSSIETSNLIATAGEEIVVEATMYSTSNTFGVNYRKAGDEEWSTLIAASNVGTSWTKLRATIEEAGTYQLQFVGTRAQIRRIYGLSMPMEPVMAVYDGEDLAGASYNFGSVANDADAVKVFTVKNEGLAKLTGLIAALSGDNAAHYTVEVSATTIAAGNSATVTVKQLKDNLGAHTATLTISATDLDDKVIALSGKTRDASKLYEDFEDGVPEEWTASGWSRSSANGNYFMQAANSGDNTLTLPIINVAANEQLSVDLSKQYNSTTPLTMRYTTDGGVTWTETDLSSDLTYGNFTTKSISLGNTETTTAQIQFVGRYYARIDNFYGGTATTAPVISLTEGGSAVESGSTKDFGTLTSEAGTATYTLSNTGTDDMVSTIAVTGDVTFEVTAMGEGVTKSENTLTIPAGKTATIVVTMAYAAPFSAKSGAMTITTTGWVGDFTINYTGTTLDPTAFYEDFAGNAKPEGWYNSGWSFTNGAVQNGLSSESTFITQKLTVAGNEDVLTYDARAYNTSWYTPVLNVSYSTDRKNWTDVAVQPTGLTNDYQTFSVSGLAQGEYYLKFTGSRIYVDNIIGWHKVTGIEHDLYVSASSIPTATKIPETEITATATVYSLRAAETGVYAKLFFDETEVVAAEGKDIAKDGSASFTLTGNVPATEKTYAAKIVVYYSNNSVAFETLTTDVEVAHTRTLAIQSFDRDGEGEMDANEQNQISPVFKVTVKNTGSTELTPIIKVKEDGVVVGTTTGTALAAGATSEEITVTATNMSAGEGGELSFTAEAYWSGDAEETAYPYATPVTITVNAAAPKFELAEKEGEAVEDGAAVSFGLVREATTKSYTITNTGIKELELVSIVAPEGYEATAVTNENKTIAVNGTLDIDVTLKALQGKKTGNLVFTYKVDANTNKTFTLSLDGQSIAEDTWVETFDTAISADWSGDISSSDWQWNSTHKAAYSSGYNYSHVLISPRLAANAGEELTFDVDFTYDGYNLKAEYSTDKATWTEIGTYEYADRGTKTFTAPADGNYYLRFTAYRYALLDNLIGFRLNQPEHEIEIASSSVPTTGTQYADYTATIRLKENLNKAEEVTAKLYVDGEAVAETTETIDAKATTTVTITWNPQEAIATEVEAYIEVTYAGGTLTTTPVSLTIDAPYELDEEDGTVAAGTYPALQLKRTFAAGWNTICLPFDVAAEDVETLFGEGATIYDLTGYVDGSLNFTKTTSLLGGYPYIVYVKKAIDEPIIVKNVTISNLNTTASYNQFNGAYFRGTYAPMEAGTMTGLWGVTTEAKIAKGNSNASMKGFRAYFTLPDGANARLNFFDTDGTTLIKSVEMEKNADGVVYNLNGQRVENMKKGNLYIINGKKQIRR